MKLYNGIFSNKLGDFPIVMKNNFKLLSFECNGYTWCGTDFDGFYCVDNQVSIEELQRFFDFQKIKMYHPEKKELYRFEIYNYSFKLEIPQVVIEVETSNEVDVLLHFEFEFKTGTEEARVSLDLKEKSYFGKGDFLELIFDQLQVQFEGKYRFKNCYGCSFGDYSIYGTGFIGPILCYKNQKQDYLKVQNKAEYMQLDSCESQQQEFYCCSEFRVRTASFGYRGTVL